MGTPALPSNTPNDGPTIRSLWTCPEGQGLNSKQFFIIETGGLLLVNVLKNREEHTAQGKFGAAVRPTTHYTTNSKFHTKYHSGHHLDLDKSIYTWGNTNKEAAGKNFPG